MLVGVFLAVTIELCGVSPLSFAVGAYLPLSTTLPIFVGGAIKGIVDRRSGARASGGHGDDVGAGSLFATGLVAGGTLTGTVVAFLHWSEKVGNAVDSLSLHAILTRGLGEGGYEVLGVVCFAVMGLLLYQIARRPLKL